jgi:phosphoserine phosphatase
MMTQTPQVAPAADNDQGDHGMLTQARRRAAFFDLRHNLLTSGSAPAVREAAARHRSAGDLLVCVTADPPPDGPTTHGTGLAADLVLYAGAPSAAAGSEVVVEAMVRLGLDAAQCFAYGDHREGLTILRVVGNPRVVGGDPLMAELARDSGWPVLPTS